VAVVGVTVWGVATDGANAVKVKVGVVGVTTTGVVTAGANDVRLNAAVEGVANTGFTAVTVGAYPVSVNVGVVGVTTIAGSGRSAIVVAAQLPVFVLVDPPNTAGSKLPEVQSVFNAVPAFASVVVVVIVALRK
jgi:hypothetical protein